MGVDSGGESSAYGLTARKFKHNQHNQELCTQSSPFEPLSHLLPAKAKKNWTHLIQTTRKRGILISYRITILICDAQVKAILRLPKQFDKQFFNPSVNDEHL